ncbi:hypothetical protein FNU76_14995 [Chitinimonas arctica]|uniref:Uncharacterized protein n=1 Tax=Chitinimonas arctica TaxID=2594795 RepID=A0A516SHE3_9NEIS|nr:hypothetical protein [Chitinimonas arctica]QDQ27555.1 hypothetical protein FNU76_14995 [Chitinimonas arctica]
MATANFTYHIIPNRPGHRLAPENEALPAGTDSDNDENEWLNHCWDDFFPTPSLVKPGEH